MLSVLCGAIVVAAVATAGDYLWYTLGVQHTMVAGLAHGAVLLTAVGAVLGAAVGRLRQGLPMGAIAGLGGAASYYPIAALAGAGSAWAIPAAWVVLWGLLALLDGRWIRARQPRSFRAIATRGLLAGVTSGVTFSLVMSTLWGPPPAGGRNYVVQFLAWLVAWTPGLMALMLGSDRHAGAVAVSSEGAAGGADGSAPATADVDSSISASDLLLRIEDGTAPMILDVRSTVEFASGRVPGAVNVPFQQVVAAASVVPGGSEAALVVYCGHGPRAYMAGAALRRSGRRVTFLRGHWSTWVRQDLPIER